VKYDHFMHLLVSIITPHKQQFLANRARQPQSIVSTSSYLYHHSFIRLVCGAKGIGGETIMESIFLSSDLEVWRKKRQE